MKKKIIIDLSMEIFPFKNTKNLKNLTYKFKLIGTNKISITFNNKSSFNNTIKNTLLISKYNNKPLIHIPVYGVKITKLLRIIKANNIKKILLLKGDINFKKNKNKLINKIHKISNDKYYKIYTSAYPGTHKLHNIKKNEFKYLKTKIKKGAKNIITQLEIDINNISNFITEIKTHNIKSKIIFGIMPFKNFKTIEYILINNNIPKYIFKKIYIIKSNIKILKYFNKININIIKYLIKMNKYNIHIYTLNENKNVKTIINKIKNK